MRNKSTYFENLDGLRAVAVIAVISLHYSTTLIFPNTLLYNNLQWFLSFGNIGGVLGVYFFFILSGFLISYLLFEEITQNTKINIWNFYKRRSLRICPLYYATILIGLFLSSHLIHFVPFHNLTKESLLLYFSFATNFDFINATTVRSSLLAVHWTVAIEVQFYLIWPILLNYLNATYIFPAIIFSLIIISEYFLTNTNNPDFGYFHSICNLRFLAFGALLAYISFYQKKLILQLLNPISKTLSCFIYISSILFLLFHKSLVQYNSIFGYVNHALSYLFFGYVILEQNFSTNSFFKASQFKILTWIGKISYGLYLTHMFAIIFTLKIFNNDPNHIFLELLVASILSILISYLSYNYFERYFLRLKNK